MTTINLAKAPRTVNGCAILKARYTPPASMTRPGHVVLVQRDTSLHPYVTAWLGEGDSGWWQGHYFDDRMTAELDFDRRTARGY